MKTILRIVTAVVMLTAGFAWAQEKQNTFLTPEEQAFLTRAAQLQKVGRDAEALAAVDQAVKAIETRLGRDVRVAAVYHIVAGAVWQLDLAAADRYFDKALAIAESLAQPKDRPALLKFLTAYAQCKLREDQYPRAKELFDRAADVALSDLLPAAFQMATDFRLAGDYVRSEWLFRYLLTHLETLTGTENDIGATIYNQLAVLLTQRGDVDEAKKLFAKAIAAAEKAYGKTSVKLQPFLFNLADTHQKLGEFREAEPLFRRALRNAEANPSDTDGVSTNLSNLGLLYVDMHRNEEARRLLERAVAIRRDGPRSIGLGVALTNLASVCSKAHEFELADSYYAEALTIAEAFLDKDRRAISILSQAASYLMDTGRKARADELLSRAADRHEKGATDLDPELADWLLAVATRYLFANDCERAVEYSRRGGSVRERNIDLLMTAGTQDQRQRYLEQSDVERDVAVSLQQHCSEGRADVARLAFETVIRRKGRSAESYADQLAAMRTRSTPEEKALLRQYADATAELASHQVGTAPASTTGTELLKTKMRSLETEISNRSAEFRRLRRRLSFEQVRDAVPEDAVLVELFAHVDVQPGTEQMTSRYMAYVVRRDSTSPTLVDMAALNEIDRAAKDWRRALSDSSSKDVDTVGAELYEKLLRPIIPFLSGKKTLIIAADGQLNLLPFGALVDPDGHYLLERYDVTYATTGRDLLRTTSTSTNKDVVVFGDPVYDLQQEELSKDPRFRSITRAAGELTERRDATPAMFATVRYQRLANTTPEAQAIQNVIPGATLVLRENATERAIKNVERPLVLHIATHGFFLGVTKDPARSNALLRSGLLFAGVNQAQSGPGEDGVLTAMEMSTMDLTGTELVVLSACDTGLGDIRVGDGVYGLRRALLLAGAASEVISLWQIQDAVTKDLMRDFYEGMVARLPRSEALRSAQLKLARSGGEHAHPFYWAAFQLSGQRGLLDMSAVGRVSTRKDGVSPQ